MTNRGIGESSTSSIELIFKDLIYRLCTKCYLRGKEMQVMSCDEYPQLAQATSYVILVYVIRVGEAVDFFNQQALACNYYRLSLTVGS